MKKKHIRSIKNPKKAICGMEERSGELRPRICDTDTIRGSVNSVMFLDDKQRTNTLAIGQGDVCAHCRKKMLAFLDHKGQNIFEYLDGKK